MITCNLILLLFSVAVLHAVLRKFDLGGKSSCFRSGVAVVCIKSLGTIKCITLSPA